MASSRRSPIIAGADRRSLAAAAARRLFSTSSYERVTLKAVAEEAGLELGQVVREFSSKEALFKESLDFSGATAPRPAPVRWGVTCADHMLIRLRSPEMELYRIVAWSGASPSAAEILTPYARALSRRIAGELTPGSHLDARSALVLSLIEGLIISNLLLEIDTAAAGPVESTKRYLARILDVLSRPPIDEPSNDPRPFGSMETKLAILKAADVAFSAHGFEHATVRGIAQEARTDPALVVRYFGSKEQLFQEVLQVHFQSPAEGPVRSASVRAQSRRLFDVMRGWSPRSIDITLRSVTSPTASAMIRKDILERFWEPMADALEGPNPRGRAMLMGAFWLGVQFCSTVLRLPALNNADFAILDYLERIYEIAETPE